MYKLIGVDYIVLEQFVFPVVINDTIFAVKQYLKDRAPWGKDRTLPSKQLLFDQSFSYFLSQIVGKR